MDEFAFLILCRVTRSKIDSYFNFRILKGESIKYTDYFIVLDDEERVVYTSFYLFI